MKKLKVPIKPTESIKPIKPVEVVYDENYRVISQEDYTTSSSICYKNLISELKNSITIARMHNKGIESFEILEDTIEIHPSLESKYGDDYAALEIFFQISIKHTKLEIEKKKKEFQLKLKEYEKRLADYNSKLDKFKKLNSKYIQDMKLYQEEQKRLNEEKELDLFKKLKEKYDK